MRLSLRYGAGDLGWFAALPREQQIAVLAAERADAPAKSSTAAGEAWWGRP